MLREFYQNIQFSLGHCFKHKFSYTDTPGNETPTKKSKQDTQAYIESHHVYVALHYGTVEFQNSAFPRILFVDFWILASDDQGFQNLQPTDISLVIPCSSHCNDLLTRYVSTVA